MMNSIRLFPYALPAEYPVYLTIESSQAGTCSYKLEPEGRDLVLKRKDARISSMGIPEDGSDITMVIGNDCRIVFSESGLLDSYEAVQQSFL
jgi:hypothetical protein